MRIGIIGAGKVAQSFARKVIFAGHGVMFSNSRGPKSLATLVEAFGDRASAGSIQEAAENTVVLLALPWPAVEKTLQQLPAWNGQILIDPTNAFVDGDPAKGLVDFNGGSSSEFVSALAPGARVVKAVNSIFMSNFDQVPINDRMRRVAFYSGDDHEAKEVIADLLQSFGFAPVNLGSLREGGLIQGVGAPVAGHDFFLPWPAPRSFPAFNGKSGR